MALSDEQRAQLGAIADELIPAGSGMPSASEAGVAGEFLDEVLAARPDLAAPLEARARAGRGACARAPRSPRCATDPDGWGVLTAVVPGAYFLNPAIRAAIGYPGLEARPIDPTPRPTTSPTGCSTR